MLNNNISFIGAGNMASSIIGGLITNGYPAKQITAANPSEDKLVKLQQQYGIHITTDNITAAEQADILVLAVKPQLLNQVCPPLHTIVQQRKPLILSVLAGKTLSILAEQLATKNLPIVRCMPNTPAMLGCGVTAVVANEYTTTAQKTIVTQLLQTIGTVIWLEQEAQINPVSAISGSGPAYFFYMMEGLIKAGIAQGLDQAMVQTLVEQTALGTAKMALANNETLTTLRHQVTSPKGSTEQGIKVLQDNNLDEILIDVVAAATKRANELAKV